ncbi:MAG: anion permease [Candidatus Nanohaloarchaeota archaeon QJJ-5]|nr:anion permease [Candidatus Nanohaloarchaeota archaeon QJJ-5]
MELLIGIGILVAIFVGINVGGSSTGVAFGPAVGGDVLSMRKAAGLMAFFAFLGGVTVGPRVVNTMGRGLVPPERFTIAASIAILLFTGLGILAGNILKISSSTSQIAVGSIAGMGIALGVIDWSVLGVIVVWWLVSSVIAFWSAAVIGRYAYDRIVGRIDLTKGNRDRVTKLIVVAVGCYMAFSAGASNVANAVAPLVGSDSIGIGMLPAVAMAGVAMAIGALFIGPRTMETIGNDITDLPLEAAFIVEIIAATIITMLSLAGIPASLAVVLTLCVIGLGWGRATKRVPLRREMKFEQRQEKDQRRVEEDDLSLYDMEMTRRFILTWMITPIVAGGLTALTFVLAQMIGVF